QESGQSTRQWRSECFFRDEQSEYFERLEAVRFLQRSGNRSSSIVDSKGLASTLFDRLAPPQARFSQSRILKLYFFMIRRGQRLLFLLIFPELVLFCALGARCNAQTSDFAKDELAWRSQHAADLQKPDGWLSLIGLEWLQPGETTLGSAKDNKIR